jgi:uncharacterized protein YegL
MKKDLTKIVMILDESGSMGSAREDVIGGFNTFVEDQKKQEGDATLTLITFAHQDTIVIDNQNIKDIEPLTPKQYRPAGCTALHDAVGTAIDTVGILLAETPEAERPEKVIFVIMTDGQENASTTYTKAIVKEKTEHQIAIYNWEFLYLGANQDAMSEAQSIGIHNFTNYTTGLNADGSDGNVAAYWTTSSCVSNFRKSGSIGDLPDDLTSSIDISKINAKDLNASVDIDTGFAVYDNDIK